MVESYKKVLEMESVTLLKLEQDKKALNCIRKILYQNKKYITEKLIEYLKKETGIKYFRYIVSDINNNVADILVKENSEIFKNNIEGKEFLEFNVEEIIDKRMFNNNDEIIITDLNFDENLLNLGYLCDSLDYNFLSYSNLIKEKLSIFINYVINKNILKNRR